MIPSAIANGSAGVQVERGKHLGNQQGVDQTGVQRLPEGIAFCFYDQE